MSYLQEIQHEIRYSINVMQREINLHTSILLDEIVNERKYKLLYGPLFIVAPNGDCWRLIRDPRRMLPKKSRYVTFLDVPFSPQHVQEWF